MTQGRPQKSKELDKLHGNPGKRKRKKKTLVRSGSKLGLPKGLSKTVKRHCSKVAKYLKDSGAPLDLIRPMFDRYCKCLQMAADAHRIIERERGDDENVLEYVAEQKLMSKRWKENSDQALKIEKQLEILLRKSNPKQEKTDPAGDFLKRGKKPSVIKGGRK